MSSQENHNSFTATLSVNGAPVVFSYKALERSLRRSDISDQQRYEYQQELAYGSNMLTISQDETPELFYFGRIDDCYVISVRSPAKYYGETVSMEGDLRNWSAFNGTDPTIFRIGLAHKKFAEIDDMPNDVNIIRLYTNSKHRPVHIYGDSGLPCFTDLQNRGGKLVSFRLDIVERHVPYIRH